MLKHSVISALFLALLLPREASCATDLLCPTVEEKIGAHAGISSNQNSLLKKYPELGAAIDQMVKQELTPREMLATNPNLTVHEFVDKLAKKADAEAERLYKLANRYEAKEPALARALRSAGADLHMGPWLINTLKSQRNRPLDTHEMENNPNLAECVNRFKGEMGELQTAIRVDDFVYKGYRFREGTEKEVKKIRGEHPKWTLAQAKERLAENTRKQIEQAFPELKYHRGEMERLLDKEIDLIFDGGASWGEVKNYSNVIDLDHLKLHDEKKYHGKSMYDQAVENAKLAKAMGKNLHQFMLGGITPEAAHALEELGITVHGTVK